MATPVADPAALAAVQDILKEVWPSDTLESQLLEETVLLDWVDDVTEYTDSDGLGCAVPLRVGRTGAIGSRGIGQKLPPASHQRVAKAKYSYTFHYVTIKLLAPIIAKMKTQRQSAVREIDFEVKYALEDTKMDLQRQMHLAGDSVLGTVASSTTSATVTVNNALGQHAIRVGWIYPGMWLDCGTAANPVASFQGQQVLDVDDVNYTITIDAAVSCTAGHGLSRYGNRIAAGQQSYEMNGLMNVVSDSGTLGGIDSTQAGNKYWKAVVLANGGTPRANSVDLMLQVEQKLRQKGSKSQLLIADLDQERKYYGLLESKVRFIGDKRLSEGNLQGLEFNGKMFVGDPHAVPGKIDFLSKGAFFTMSAGELSWQNQTTGGDILAWVQDEDAFVARAAKYMQLGTNHRNGLGSLRDLN